MANTYRLGDGKFRASIADWKGSFRVEIREADDRGEEELLSIWSSADQRECAGRIALFNEIAANTQDTEKT